jgi:RimJ/RimL family protein N-acetyltransferase
VTGPAERSAARLRLRRPTAGDIPVLAGIGADPRTNVRRPGGSPNQRVAEATVRSFIDEWARNGFGYWAVEFEGALVGVAGVRPVDFRNRRCWNLYYRFSPASWGKGLAAEAAREALAAAHARDAAMPVVARTRPANEAAMRLAERIGMERRADLDGDGFAVFVSHW